MDSEKQEPNQAQAASLQDVNLEAPPAYNDIKNNYSTTYSSPTVGANGAYPPAPPGIQNYGYVHQGPPGQPGAPYHQHQPVMVITQQPGLIPQNRPPVPDHFGLAIFVTICCCWPLGVVALLRARDSREAVARNDYDTAVRLSGESKRMSIIGMICGACFSILFVVIIVVAIAL